MNGETQHRLAAIVAADVVGYSRLISADEAGTLAAMRAHRAELWDIETKARGGRVVGTAGDSLLFEFPSAVAAVECCVAIQRGMAARNAGTAEDRRIRLRIGVNLGEVVVDGDDIHGDGVNIAARLEAEAEPDGLCLSDDVVRQVRGRLALDFTGGDEQALKNIAVPVRTWHWREDAAPGAVDDGPDETPTAPPAIPDKPSIAVLPFNNMSGDPEQEYFSDGISEDLTTALSRFAGLFVIARNSAFRYKGETVDVKRVGQELGVRYVLEGSIRHAGDRVRVNAQLIDAEDDRHVWAERYDRQIDDVFELQDDIVASIAAAVGPEVTLAEIERVRTRRPKTLDAWDLYLRAMSAFHRMTKDDIVEAIDRLDQAIGIEADFANAYAFKSLCHAHDGMYGWVKPASMGFTMALSAAEDAVRLAPANPEAHYALAFVLSTTGKPESAVTAARRAVDLNPNFAEAYGILGLALTFSGDLEGGLAACKQAMRSNPRDGRGRLLLNGMGHAYYMLGDYENAIEVSNRQLQLDSSNYGALVTLAGTYARLDRMDDARRHAEQLLRLIPRFNLRALRKNPMFVRPEHIEKLVEGLRLAGVPE